MFLKSCLSLYHGSAETEQRFSISNNILSKERTLMKEGTLNVRLNIVDVLRPYSNQAALVPITRKLIKTNIAYQAYNSYLENEKREQERKKRYNLSCRKGRK